MKIFAFPKSNILNIPNLKRFAVKFLRVGANHPFELSVALMFIAVLIGGALYYRYINFTKNVGQLIDYQPVRFHQDLYSKVTSGLKERELQFSRTIEIDYRDPFFVEERGGEGEEEKLTE